MGLRAYAESRLGLIAILSLVACIGAAAIFLTGRIDRLPGKSRNRRVMIIAAILAGLANLGLLAMDMMLCSVWLNNART